MRLVPDLAFVAGLPARILAAKGIAAGQEPAMPVIVQTLSGVVRKGCASPEQLANAIHLKEESRPSARQSFENIAHLIQPGDPFEDFDAVMARIRDAHILAMFDEL